jgi:hypothetical protein
MEEKNSSRVICLFFPPLINNFDFQSGTEIEFFNPQSGLKINQFLSKLAGKKLRKLVLINYPTEEKQVEELHSELARIGLKITEVLLCNPINYELMTEVQNKYLLCPKCEKIFERTTTIEENKEFICPRDNEKYTLAKVNKFSEIRLANYFKNSGKVVEKILGENKQKFPFFHKLDISQEKEIVSGELGKKILKAIDSF